MFYGEGNSDAGRRKNKNLPTFIQFPLMVFEKLIPVSPNPRFMLALAIASDELIEANPELIRALYMEAVCPGIRKFIAEQYVPQLSDMQYNARQRAPYTVDSPDNAAKFAGEYMYACGAVDDLRLRFNYYYDLEKQNGKSAPADLNKYGDEMIRYYLKDTAAAKENGETGISIPSSEYCPHADELQNEYEAVRSAFEKVENASFIISSNCVYTCLYHYLRDVLKQDVAEKALYSVIGIAAEKQDETICRQFEEAKANALAKAQAQAKANANAQAKANTNAQAKANTNAQAQAKTQTKVQAKPEEYDGLIAKDSIDVTDLEIYSYCFGARMGCRDQNRLLAISVIVYNALLYRAGNNGKDERTRERIIRKKCDVKKFYNEFITSGMTVGELLDWTVTHLSETLNFTLYPYSKIHTENKFRDAGILDAPIISLLPSKWNQKSMSRGNTTEDIHCDYISHFTGKLRGKVLERFEIDGNLKAKKAKKAKKSKKRTVRGK